MDSNADWSLSLENSNNENRAPPILPLILNSMLKTTTESGDVGQFAIKPSRVPQSSKPPKITGATYNVFALQRPFNVTTRSPMVDDRKRLPSYARYAASEIGSIYETTSQNSLRRTQFPRETGNRSYSMTQTSYSSHPLSNHRSYTSLRTQPELSLVQRPRSPFPYPARLKRLGFRSTSPVLTDGGNSDVQRTPDGYGTTRSASPSIYANKRVPAALRRSNATRSNPSLLSHSPSSQRSNLSPQHSSIGSPHGWNTRTEKASGKASPTHAPFNVVASSSAITTAGKLVPSPLYYDYTEEFNIDEAANGTGSASEKLPPPPFSIEKTIHEDRKLSSESFHPGNSFIQGTSVGLGLRRGSESSIEDNPYSADKPETISDEDHTERTTNITQDIIPLYLDRSSFEIVPPATPNTKILPCTDSLNITIDEDFLSNESHSNTLPIISNPAIQKSNSLLEDIQHTGDCGIQDQNDGIETASVFGKGSSFRLSSLLPDFPNPPSKSGSIKGGDIPSSHDQTVPNALSNESHRDFERQGYVLRSQVVHEDLTPNAKLSSYDEQFSLSSGDIQQDVAGVNMQAALSTKRKHDFEAGSGSSHSDVLHSGSTTLQSLPTSPAIICRQSRSRMDLQVILNKFRSEDDLKAPRSRAQKPLTLFYPEDQTTNTESKEKPNELPEGTFYELQFGKELLLRPDSPMLAPQPISPARVLKLKNSIPQLMKALPPIPQDFTYPVSRHGRVSSYDLSSNPPFFSLALGSKAIQKSAPRHVGPVAPSIASAIQSQSFHPVKQSSPIFPPPHKFKLKSKFFTIKRSPSPPSSRPWNLEDGYPWVAEQSNIHLPSLNLNNRSLRRPSKFKLRTIEAFDDVSGTVKINSNAKGRGDLTSLDLRNPKDLFTSAPNLGDVFRQVSKQFGSGSANASAEAVSTEPYLASPVTTYPMSRTEVRSFFSDNSSQVRSYNSLRKRITDLRARFPHSYISRSAAQIDGNLISTQISDRSTLTHVAPRLDNGNMQILDEYGMPVTETRHQGLKAKVLGWLREAHIAVRWRGKTDGDDEAWCIPLHR